MDILQGAGDATGARGGAVMARVAIRTHRSRKAFARYPIVLQEMQAVHEDKIKAEYIKTFKAIVANWKNKPGFTSRKVLDADSYRLYVYPTGSDKAKQLWAWNVEGTKAHPIAAKYAPMLVFPWGGRGSYIAKTGPGGKWYGGPGIVVNPKTVRTKAVIHPGTAPRNWPEIVAKKKKAFYSREVENAWKRALRKMSSG